MTVDPLVVMPDDARDFIVVIDLGENSLANYWVLFHLSTLL